MLIKCIFTTFFGLFITIKSFSFGQKNQIFFNNSTLEKCPNTNIQESSNMICLKLNLTNLTGIIGIFNTQSLENIEFKYHKSGKTCLIGSESYLCKSRLNDPYLQPISLERYEYYVTEYKLPLYVDIGNE